MSRHRPPVADAESSTLSFIIGALIRGQANRVRLPMRLQGRILKHVTNQTRRTLAVIRECLASDRYAMTVHFSERMVERGLFWTDVQAVIGDPSEVRSQGTDDYDQPKWIIGGEALTGDEIEIVCAVEIDESETEFITLYWDD
jgi:hypothetical protein